MCELTEWGTLYTSAGRALHPIPIGRRVDGGHCHAPGRVSPAPQKPTLVSGHRGLGGGRGTHGDNSSEMVTTCKPISCKRSSSRGRASAEASEPKCCRM